MQSALPHVNHAFLRDRIDHQVRLVGEVMSIESGRVQLRTSDDVKVIVHTKPSSMQYSRFVCFTGTWRSQGVLEEDSYINLSDNADLNLWNQMLHLMHGPYRHLFVPDA